MAYASAIGVVLLLAIGGDATPGDVILVVGLASQVSTAVLTAVIYATAFLRVLTLAKRFVWLERYAAGAQRVPEEPAAVADRLRRGITLHEASFAYPDTGRLAAGRWRICPPEWKVARDALGRQPMISMVAGGRWPAGEGRRAARAR